MSPLRLAFDRFGAGDPLARSRPPSPVLILHGLFGSRSNWFGVARPLAEDGLVVVADQRNHGESPHAAPHTLSAMAADAALLLEELGAGPALVVGHSMGGKVAMELAFRRPDLVRAVVSVDMAPRRYGMGDRFEGVLAAIRACDPPSLADRRQAHERMEPHVPEKSVRDFLLKNLEVDPAGAFRWRFGLADILADFEALGSPAAPGDRYDGPALFLYGGASDYLRPEDRPLCLAHFPNATFAEVSGAGHWVHAERPAETLAILKDFRRASFPTER